MDRPQALTLTYLSFTSVSVPSSHKFFLFVNSSLVSMATN